MRKKKHIGGLREPQRPQIGGGKGSGKFHDRAVLRHHAPVREPDAHVPVPKFQHPALRRGKDKGNQPAGSVQGGTEKSCPRPARHASLRHGHEVQHFPRAGAVTRLIHPPPEQGGNLPAVQDVLRMIYGHQFTRLSRRKREGQRVGPGLSCASASTFARSSACSKS